MDEHVSVDDLQIRPVAGVLFEMPSQSDAPEERQDAAWRQSRSVHALQHHAVAEELSDMTDDETDYAPENVDVSPVAKPVLHVRLPRLTSEVRRSPYVLVGALRLPLKPG